MSRLTDLLTRVRDSLSDPNAERWSDPRLLRLVDQGQKVINTRVKALTEVITLSATNSWATFSSAPLQVLTAYQGTNEVSVTTTVQMLSSVGPSWETETNSNLALVLNSNQPTKYRLYGAASATLSVVVVTEPAAITSTSSELTIQSSLDTAVLYFVVSMALRDDQDTQNRQAAIEYATLAGQELEAFKQTYATDTKTAKLVKTRVSKILDLARSKLGDKSGLLWSDSELLNLVESGQQQLLNNIPAVYGKAYLSLDSGRSYYNFPEDFRLLNAVQYKGIDLPLYCIQEVATAYGEDWTVHTGDTPLCVVYDKVNPMQFIVYPRQTLTRSWPEVYGVVTDSEVFTLDDLEGVVSDLDSSGNDDQTFIETNIDYESSPVSYHIEYSLDSLYGVVTNIPTSLDLLNDETKLVIYYAATPGDLSSVTDQLVVPKSYDLALQYFVVWQASLVSSALQPLSSVMGQLYVDEKTKLEHDRALGNVQSLYFTSKYKGAFDQ